MTIIPSGMVPYLIAKPDSLAVLLWSAISIGNTAR